MRKLPARIWSNIYHGFCENQIPRCPQLPLDLLTSFFWRNPMLFFHALPAYLHQAHHCIATRYLSSFACTSTAKSHVRVKNLPTLTLTNTTKDECLSIGRHGVQLLCCVVHFTNILYQNGSENQPTMYVLMSLISVLFILPPNVLGSQGLGMINLKYIRTSIRMWYCCQRRVARQV